MSGARRVLFVFLDGVGVGSADSSRNPFLRARLPTLRRLLGGRLPTLDEPELDGPSSASLPLDATLGVPGTPQSGTGQTALLTGRNAPRLFGRHFGPWTPVRLRPLLEEHNLLVRSRAAGVPTVFANAYPEGYPEDRSTRVVAAPTLAARAAGLLDRHHESLARGEAVASEIVNDGWRRGLGHRSVPRITPADAGRNLARLAGTTRLTLYAHYATDTAGHRGGMAGAVEALERVDAFLAGIVDALADDALLVVASDHGNVEEVDAEHTRNPALGLIHGAGAGDVRARLRSITDVPVALLEVLGIPGTDPTSEGRTAGELGEPQTPAPRPGPSDGQSASPER